MLRDGVEPTDGQLLEHFVKDRDEAALEALVRRHGSMVWGVCRRVLANHHDAEDAFQVTFLVLVRKASSVKPRDMVGNWLYGVAQQTALKARATSAKRRTREQQVNAMPEPTAAPADHADNLAPLLDQELSRLPDKYRAVLVLCELEGKTIKEAAKQLGVPDGTIASRLARGRTMLAKRLARHNLGIAGAALPALLAQQAAATVPPPVLAAAIKVALLVAGGKAGGIVSIAVTSLTEEMVKAMLLTKLRNMSAVVLLVLASCALAYGAYSRFDVGLGEGAAQAGKKTEPGPEILRPGEGENPEPEGQQPPERAAAKLNILDMRQKQLKDEDLAKLPEDIDGLLLRGFQGYGTNTVTDEGIKHLTRFKRLRILAAGALGLTDRALESIGRLTSLEELELDSNTITGKGLHHLAGLKKLRKLDLNFNKLGPATLELLIELPELTSLHIYDTGPVDDRVCELCSRAPNLKQLALSENTAAVTDRGVESLAKLRHLENLALRSSPKVTDAGLAAIAGMTRLKTLRLSGLPSVTPEGMKQIGKLTDLRMLNINVVPMDAGSVRTLTSLTKLEDFALWSVASHPLPLDSLGALRSLRRIRTNMSLSSSAIRALARLQNLESITDELFEITDEDLTHLAKLTNLKVLILGSDKITAASLPTLAKMKSLRELFVTEKVGITPEQLTALGRDSLTECHIARFRPPYTVYHKKAE
jgi:RNA polymerase sigma factor (sigma-70 family)